MLIKLYEEDPNSRQLRHLVECLKNGGILILPTDTVYAIACDIKQTKAIERLSVVKGERKEHANYSLLCHDLSELSNYAQPIDNATFKLMKKTLPGPYTFILKANNAVPKIFQEKKKTVGIRVPDNRIVQRLIEELGNPMVSTSISMDVDDIEEITDPELIHERYQKLVDMVIDGGTGGTALSSVLDCSNGDVIVLREGKGNLDML